MPMPSSSTPDREVLAGIVGRVTFQSAETGFCVLRVKARGQRDLVTIGPARLGDEILSLGRRLRPRTSWQAEDRP